jgi:hypothetical protein
MAMKCRHLSALLLGVGRYNMLKAYSATLTADSSTVVSFEFLTLPQALKANVHYPPRLHNAQANNGNEVSSLASLLLAVGRYNSLEAAYIASRLPLITAIWDEAAAMLASSSSSSAAAASAAAAAAPAGGGAGSGGLAGGWLLLLYNNLMGLLEGDAAWLGGCLEQQRQQLLVALMAAAFDKVRSNRHAAHQQQQAHITTIAADTHHDSGNRHIQNTLHPHSATFAYLLLCGCGGSGTWGLRWKSDVGAVARV